jgi:hypothetical protein
MLRKRHDITREWSEMGNRLKLLTIVAGFSVGSMVVIAELPEAPKSPNESQNAKAYDPPAISLPPLPGEPQVQVVPAVPLAETPISLPPIPVPTLQPAIPAQVVKPVEFTVPMAKELAPSPRVKGSEVKQPQPIVPSVNPLLPPQIQLGGSQTPVPANPMFVPASVPDPFPTVVAPKQNTTGMLPPPSIPQPVPNSVPTPIATPKPVPSQPTGTPAFNIESVKLTLRLGSGEPRFEIRDKNTDDVMFKVIAEGIELKQPEKTPVKSSMTGLKASGMVRFFGPGIEGTCSELTLISGSGELLLAGNVHLKTKRGRIWSEVNSDKMMLYIGSLIPSAPAATFVPYTSYFKE